MKISISKLKEKQIITLQVVVMLSLLIFLGIILEGCTDKCERTVTYTYFEPVYTTTDEIREAFEVQLPKTLESPGKIYIYGNYLLINEVEKGIHIIENSNCGSPEPLAFINIPGNFDLAVKDNILYADSYVDLLAIDISDLKNIKLLKRLESVFPLYNTRWEFSPAVDAGFASEAVITEWVEVEKEVTETECDDIPDVLTMRDGVAFSSSAMAEGGAVQGKGGSMARFAIYQDYLYAVDFNNMHVFDITTLSDPKEGNTIDMGWGIETIFPYKDKLFIGAQNGMHIYDNENPVSPAYMSSFMHVTTCDPVVVNDEYAFVTLRSGNECQGFTNQLDIIDIADLEKPSLVDSYPMENPHGLGLDQNLLFITEGEFGFKVFQVDDPKVTDIEKLATIEGLHGFDVIPNDGILLLIGEDGLYQYIYEDHPEDPELCSVIPIANPNK